MAIRKPLVQSDGRVNELSSSDKLDLNSIDVMVGDSGTGGQKGLVPAPLAGDVTKFLRGDGIFAPVSGGGGESAFEQTFGTPAMSWTVNHNLGRKPIVSVLNSGGVEIEAAVIHTSINQFIVSFTLNVAGMVRCI